MSSQGAASTGVHSHRSDGSTEAMIGGRLFQSDTEPGSVVLGEGSLLGKESIHESLASGSDQAPTSHASGSSKGIDPGFEGIGGHHSGHGRRK
ncbi:hypothetical protein ACKKBG_A34430 [Auxenochlorella protothecoides x Auxenochlorella symbiontica]